MNILKKIFGNNKAQQDCPRCLGKGHVDANDIKRLNKELRWRPGPCAYCNGTGKINPEIEKNVPVDTAYLTTDLGPDERNRIIKGNAAAWERAAEYDMHVEDFIKQVCYLHFETGLTARQVTDFYLMNHHNSYTDEIEKKALYDYVSKIIFEKAG